MNTRLAEHFYGFCNEFKKFNKIGVQMLDSIYHMSFNYFELIFLV